MHRIAGLMLSMALALGSGALLAHSDEELDARPSPHGGQVRMAGGLHLELVLAREGDATQPRPIVVHVSDHADQPQSTSGGRATVTLLAPKMAPLRVELKPDGQTRLVGSAVYPDDPMLKAVVQITLPELPTEQARFEPLAPRKAADGHEHHDHDHEHDHKH
ncbi:MAG: hypothetical protein MUE46_08970 [Xanthomonadales bacterium]|jgi:hypothetical protein|nr:hypothetical protein [Xanthomonadales bacterium]